MSAYLLEVVLLGPCISDHWCSLLGHRSKPAGIESSRANDYKFQFYF